MQDPPVVTGRLQRSEAIQLAIPPVGSQGEQHMHLDGLTQHNAVKFGVRVVVDRTTRQLHRYVSRLMPARMS